MKDRTIPLRVFLAGPINSVTPGGECEQFLNVRRMVSVADDLTSLGFVVLVPALCSFWHMLSPKPREVWALHSKSQIRSCDAVFRMGRPSVGADADAAYAEANRIPVFVSLDFIAEWAKEHSDFHAEIIEHGMPVHETAEIIPIDPTSLKACDACGGNGKIAKQARDSSQAGYINVTCPMCGGKGVRASR